MKKYKNFNPVEFNFYVKVEKETIGHVISSTKSKYLIRQVGMDHNYNVEDVYNYLHEITMETYPEYMFKLNHSDWRKIYSSYMHDEDLAPKLKEALEFRKGKKDNDFYRDSFFEAIRELGVNPYIMKIDKALDFFGWIHVINLIIKKAEKESFEGEFVPQIKVVERETTRKEKSAMKKVKSVKKGSKGSRPVGQFTEDGKLVREFSSVKEATTVLNSETGKKRLANNIYQSCNKGCSAYGYFWKYLGEVSEIKGSEEMEVKSVEETIPVEDTTTIESVEEKKLEKSGDKVKEVFVAYYLNKDKTIDRTREIGRFCSHKDTYTSLGINKGVLSNYLKGRKDSIFWNNEDGQKVRIGVEKLAA